MWSTFLPAESNNCLCCFDLQCVLPEDHSFSHVLLEQINNLTKKILDHDRTLILYCGGSGWKEIHINFPAIFIRHLCKISLCQELPASACQSMDPSPCLGCCLTQMPHCRPYDVLSSQNIRTPCANLASCFMMATYTHQILPHHCKKKSTILNLSCYLRRFKFEKRTHMLSRSNFIVLLPELNWTGCIAWCIRFMDAWCLVMLDGLLFRPTWNVNQTESSIP